MPKMTEEEFRGVIDAEVTQAAAWSNTVMSADRERNLAYYHGHPMGNEVDGRSQVVSWDVFEVCESALPSLIEPFFSGDRVGEFEPVGREDEAYCEQATDYVNHLIKKKNNGFILFNTWVKDGLLSKVGITRVWWDAREKKRREEYTGQTEEQLILLDQDPRVEIVSNTEYPDPDDEQHREQAMQALATMPPEQQAQVQQMLARPVRMLHDVEVIVNAGPNGVCIENIPPENFVLSRRAKRMEDLTIIGEQRRYTRSELVEMGYDRARVDRLSDYNFSHTLGELSTERDEDAIESDAESADKSLQEIAVFFGFIRADFDDDGIAEWRRVLLGGNDMLENDPVDDHEYCLWSPILLPHRIIGMAYADPLIEIQNLKTALTRQFLDTLYLANNPRTWATPDVNLDDLLSTRIGGIVRMKNPNSAGPLITTVVANESLQGIQLADSMRENRIGVTKYNQGLDADTLNKTAHGVERIMTAAEKRLLMTLRIFAETGVKDLFKKCLRLTCEYQDKPSTIRMRGTWVDYDPRTWSSEMDVTVNVGLGNGDNAQTLMHLQSIGQFMQQAAPMGLVRPNNWFNLGKMLMKNAKIQGGAELLLTDPATAEPIKPQKPPEAIIAEAEMEVEKMRQAGKREEAKLKTQMDQEKLDAEVKLKGLDLQLKEKEIRLKEIELGLKHMQMQRDAVRPVARQLIGPDGQVVEQQSSGLEEVLIQQVDQLAAQIMAPREIVRDPQTGAIIGATVNGVFHQLVLDDQGRPAGFTPATN